MIHSLYSQLVLWKNVIFYNVCNSEGLRNMISIMYEATQRAAVEKQPDIFSGVERCILRLILQ